MVGGVNIPILSFSHLLLLLLMFFFLNYIFLTLYLYMLVGIFYLELINISFIIMHTDYYTFFALTILIQFTFCIYHNV